VLVNSDDWQGARRFRSPQERRCLVYGLAGFDGIVIAGPVLVLLLEQMKLLVIFLFLEAA